MKKILAGKKSKEYEFTKSDGKTFKAAKFDWISTSRTSRSFENIYDHYNGFDPDKFFSAKHRCFFIMSKDGKRRTNVLVD